jgi:hypothetical protein
MSSLPQMADSCWQPVPAPNGSCWSGGAAHHPAAKLLLALVRWHMRRLERRIAALQIDERSLR